MYHPHNILIKHMPTHVLKKMYILYLDFVVDVKIGQLV
jgi:hypothetical protein